MLTIIYGDAENSIYNTSVYFKNCYEPEWFDSDLAKAIMKDVDDTSGGVKTLLLMLNEPEKIFNASTCGDNCAKWILEIGKRIDLTINLRHMMNFGKNSEFEIKIANGNEMVHSMRELISIAGKYLNAMKQE